MKTTKALVVMLALFAIITTVGCKWLNTNAPANAPSVADNIRKALDAAGLKDVTIAHNSDKDIFTLGGQVISSDQKAQAEALTKYLANGEVVANQIAIIPPGQGQQVKAVNADIDQAIAKNLDAALIQNGMHNDVKYEVKNAVVTLNGSVISEEARYSAERTANSVANVQQVVNALQVKNQKASSAQ
jgi:osmotically-inducible protein OsmY